MTRWLNMLAASAHPNGVLKPVVFVLFGRADMVPVDKAQRQVDQLLAEAHELYGDTLELRAAGALDCRAAGPLMLCELEKAQQELPLVLVDKSCSSVIQSELLIAEHRVSTPIMPLSQFTELLESAGCEAGPDAVSSLRDRCLIAVSERMLVDWVILDAGWLVNRLLRAVLDPLCDPKRPEKYTRTEVTQLLRLHAAEPQLVTALLDALATEFQLQFKAESENTQQEPSRKPTQCLFRVGPEYRSRAVQGSYPQLIKRAATPKKHVLSSPMAVELRASVRTLQEVQKILPPEYFELKQMMDMHIELKAQMASNREKLTEYKDVEEEDGSNVMALLREQASHVVSMMKDVLVRMEAYPEQLWALYGTVEAYEGGLTDEAIPEDMMDIYCQILVHVQTFLAVEPDTK